MLLLRAGLYSNCHNVNPTATAVGGIYGYSHTTGGYDGGPDEYVRVPIEHKFLTPVFGTSCPPKGLSGVLSEGRRYGFASRVGKKRTDLVHQSLDPLLVAGPWVAAGGAAFVAGRALVRAGRKLAVPR